MADPSYSEKQLRNIHFLNEILDDLDQPKIEENGLFKRDEEVSGYGYAAYRLTGHENPDLHLSVHIAQDAIWFNIDRMWECFEWGQRHIDSEPELVKSWIRTILTSHILIEHRGSGFTRIRFFNREGVCTNSCKLYDRIWMFGRAKFKLYTPVFENRS